MEDGRVGIRVRNGAVQLVHIMNTAVTIETCAQAEAGADGEHQSLQAPAQRCVPGASAARGAGGGGKVQLLQLHQLRVQRSCDQPGHGRLLCHKPHHKGTTPDLSIEQDSFIAVLTAFKSMLQLHSNCNDCVCFPNSSAHTL